MASAMGLVTGYDTTYPLMANANLSRPDGRLPPNAEEYLDQPWAEAGRLTRPTGGVRQAGSNWAATSATRTARSGSDRSIGPPGPRNRNRHSATGRPMICPRARA